MPSCSKCVHRIQKESNISDIDGRGVYANIDVCGFWNKVIGNAKYSYDENEELQSKIAENCSMYYTENPKVKNIPKVIRKRVTFGKNVKEKEISESQKKKPLLSNCRLCKFSTQNIKDIEDKIGLRSNSLKCTKYAAIIVDNKLSASNCLVGEPMTISDKQTFSIEEIEIDKNLFLDEYKPVSVLTNTVSRLPDPLQMSTWREVTEGDKAEGIISWGCVTMDGLDIFYPVFDPNIFSEEERNKIPRPGDDECPDMYQDYFNLFFQYLAIWEMDGTPAINGAAGLGKTEAARYMAYMMQLPFERISITNSTEIDELAGRTEFSKEHGTYFQLGRVPKAWKKPCVIVIDEPNVGPPDVWQFLRPLFDNSKQLVLDMSAGERIPRNKHCYMSIAMNPAWDVRNVGTHEISDADGRRLMHIHIPSPPPEVEKKIVVDRCLVDGYQLPDGIYKKIERIAKDIRNLCKNDTLPIQWGTAQQIKVARATKYFGLKKCYQLAIGDLLDPESSEMLLATVASHDSPVKKNPMTINKEPPPF